MTPSGPPAGLVPRPSPDPRWSPRTWAVVGLTLAGLQVALLAGITRWPQLPAPSSSGLGAFRLELPPSAGGRSGTGGDSEAHLAQLLAGDPRQFSRPDARGFSGTAARALPATEYTLTEWRFSPQWWPADPQGRHLGKAPAVGGPTLRAWPLPWPRSVPGEAPTPGLLASPPRVEVVGELASRPLAQPLEPPVWPVQDVLNATVIEITVAPSGSVATARLVASSGVRDADQTALEQALQARFERLPDSPDDADADPATWVQGHLVFPWRTLPSAR